MTESIDYSAHYERFHPEGAEHFEQMAGWMGEVLGPHLPADRKGKAVDIGCGFGYALGALKAAGFNDLTGLEISPQQAERCRKSGFQVELVDDTVQWLKAHPSGFDLIVMTDVLEHIEVAEQIEFLRAIHGGLRPGGRLILTTPNANSPLASRWRYIDHTHHSSFTEHSLHFTLQNAGFGNIVIEGAAKLGRPPMKLWQRSKRQALRKWIVRWCWTQVFRAELPWENLEDISFELNLTAVSDRT